MIEHGSVFLWDRHAGEPTEATLVEFQDAVEVENAVEAWTIQAETCAQYWLSIGRPCDDWPDHYHWDWNRKARRYSRLLAYKFLGIACEGKMQGLMLIDSEGHVGSLIGQKDKPLVYVDYIATAPWNDPGYVSDPRFGLVGKLLIAAAIQQSRELGFRGRLALHSLPKAEAFYRDRCSMTDLGLHIEVEGLRYFEMTSEQAGLFLTSDKERR